MTKVEQFFETFRRMIKTPPPNEPRVYLVHELLRELLAVRTEFVSVPTTEGSRPLRKPALVLLRPGAKRPSDQTVLDVAELIAAWKPIEAIVLIASRAGGFTGAFFELLWLCDVEPQATSFVVNLPPQPPFKRAPEPALDPQRQDLTPRQRRVALADELKDELKRIADGNRRGVQVPRVFVKGRTTTRGYEIYRLLLLTNASLSVVRTAARGQGPATSGYFTPEFFRRLEECQ